MVENSLLLCLFSFFILHRLLFPNLLVLTMILVVVYYPLDAFSFPFLSSCLLVAIVLRTFGVVTGHPDLEGFVLSKLSFVLLPTLVGRRHAVYLHRFLVVKLRKLFLGPNQTCKSSCFYLDHRPAIFHSFILISSSFYTDFFCFC